MGVQNAVVPALERALNIIEYLAAANSPVSLKQISSELNIPAASAFRLIKNLVNRGYVTELATGQSTFMLGNKIMAITTSYERNSSLHVVAKPYMIALASQLQQTVQLAQWQSGNLIFVAQAFSSAPMSIIAPLYVPLAINLSASAKVILGYLSEEDRDIAIRDCPFNPLTSKTITDREIFLQEVLRSRLQGYGVDNEEFSIGIGCLAVPIFDGNGSTIAALGITGRMATYKEPETFQKMLETLKGTSEKITGNLSSNM